MEIKVLPVIGDVIVSPKFAFGRHEFHQVYDLGKETVFIDGKSKTYPRIIEGNKKPVDFAAYNKSRGKANFVVEQADHRGGGQGHGGHDNYSDGYLVVARKLNVDGSYDEEGEVIAFYIGGNFNMTIAEPNGIVIVRRMKRIFV